MQYGDPDFISKMINKTKKRNIFNRLSDALFSFFDTLWSFKNFRRSVYIGVLLLIILYLEIYYPTFLPTIVYSAIGIVSLASDELQKIFKPDVFVVPALIVIISLLWRIASLLERKK
jgi:hypothetical protein